MVPFEFARGETISLALDAVEGGVAGVTSVTAKLKVVGPGGSVVSSGLGTAFEVSARAAAGEDPGGWTLTIGAAQSAALKPGLYRADARMEIGSGVVITDAISLRIIEPVSGS
ncbi:MAG TPA: hypothetical protein VF631_10535 [Allosphingosinicella sp.]|jgi:hypothetical protein|uniref:hypothetical protein n=1 Tax=Allosphingosinicella sp. TaxID=2823234 RepID=UPI002F29A406